MTNTRTSPLRFLALLALWLLISLGQAQATETITYFHNDVAGTPILATDATGDVVWKENYQPYGSRINNASGGDNSQWFAGKPYDSSTGLSYFGARYYDPVIGRFTGMDPAAVDPGNIHGLNRYSYGNNNPFRFVDPDGRQSQEIDEDAARLHEQYVAGVGKDIARGGEATLEFGWEALKEVALGKGLGVIVGLGVKAREIQLFRNLAPGEKAVPAVLFPASQIQRVAYSGRLNYVVTKSGELIIGRTGHISLSGGAEVLAAGEARFVNGALRSINNASGHYQPSGASAGVAAESAFEKAGFDAAGKYSERSF